MESIKLLEETIEDFYQNCVENEQSEYAVPRILHSLLIARRPATVVEIGSNMGFCSMAMASALKFNAEYSPSDYLKKWKSDYHPVRNYPPVKGKLYCIDPVLQPHFERRLKKFSFENIIEFIKKPSDEFDPQSLPPIDFLFIDGDHSYKAAHHDFTRFVQRVAPGGYIAVHDYFPNSPSAEMLWWGPNILSKQVRQAFQFTDTLILDTSFSGLALFRKKIEHIDYDLLDTNLAWSFIQFYLRKYKLKLGRIKKKTLALISNQKQVK